MREKSLTTKQTELLYALIDQYGGDEKMQFKRDIMSFLNYDRMLMKGRLNKAIAEVL